jgi:hypothetical protein
MSTPSKKVVFAAAALTAGSVTATGFGIGPALAAPAGQANNVPRVSAAISTQKWGRWYSVSFSGGGKIADCRNYISITSGSRIKYRAYTECRKKVFMTVFVAGNGGGHSRACFATTWCDAVRYVKNKKGAQRWCAGATAAVEMQASPPKGDARTCISY